MDLGMTWQNESPDFAVFSMVLTDAKVFISRKESPDWFSHHKDYIKCSVEQWKSVKHHTPISTLNYPRYVVWRLEKDMHEDADAIILWHKRKIEKRLHFCTLQLAVSSTVSMRYKERSASNGINIIDTPGTDIKNIRQQYTAQTSRLIAFLVTVAIKFDTLSNLSLWPAIMTVWCL